jgi:hypothetical protein
VDFVAGRPGGAGIDGIGLENNIYYYKHNYFVNNLKITNISQEIFLYPTARPVYLNMYVLNIEIWQNTIKIMDVYPIYLL